MKSIHEYLALPWTFETTWSEDPIEPWTTRVKELSGCMSHGKTPAEAAEQVMEAIAAYITGLLEDGQPVPEPLKPGEFRGQIPYRTKPEKHYRLAKEAQRRGISINKLIDEAVDNALAS